MSRTATDFHTRFQWIICLALLALPVSVLAENNEEWEYYFTSYLWVTGQKGDVATIPPAAPAEIDVSFSDIIENLDMALMVFFEAKKGRFGFIGEVFHVGISADVDTPGSHFSGADYEQDLWVVTLGGSYQLTQNNQYQLDALLGVRHWDLDNTFDLDAGSLAARKVSERERWIDILIGLHGQVTLNERWYLSGAGSFAVAGDSDRHWDVYGGLHYQYSDGISFLAGYRHQEVDYDDGDFLFDVEMSGPVLGLTVVF
ncbi:MAG: hypothetical protein HRT93_07035 [Piscirickettsiaceae bacterium]|nr:hypothetical protein [Piscirickettsiaceae bacterium]